MLKNLLIVVIILLGQNRFSGAVDYDALYDEVFGNSAIDNNEWDVVDEVNDSLPSKCSRTTQILSELRTS